MDALGVAHLVMASWTALFSYLSMRFFRWE